jgi:Fur family ferric uptake transcriptional regulator
MSPKTGSPRGKSIIDICKEKGIKVTRKRGLVAELLESSQGHQSADAIFKLAREKDPTIGQATVYRTLKLFSSAGVIDALTFRQDHSKFESSLKKHHDHLVCTKCGRIEEFADDELENMKERVAKSHRFTMESHTLEIYGVCSECVESGNKAG